MYRIVVRYANLFLQKLLNRNIVRAEFRNTILFFRRKLTLIPINILDDIEQVYIVYKRSQAFL